MMKLGILFTVLMALNSGVWAAESSLGMASMRSGPVFTEKEVEQVRGTVAHNPLQLEGSVDSAYIVGPGDYFELLLPYGTDVVQVSAEGNISIPGCGLAKVGGLALEQAKSAIQQVLRLRYETKFTAVQLIQLKRLRINILGACASVGQLVIEGQTRLSWAVRSMGGLLPVADREAMYIIRGKDTIRVNYALLDAGDIAHDPMIEQGDIIVVPYMKRNQAVVLRTPNGVFPVTFSKGKTIAAYMTLAGLDRTLDPGYQLVRVASSDGKEQWMTLANARTYTPDVQTEVEFLMRKPYVYVGGAVAAMGVVEYNPAYHAVDYVAAAGVTIVTGGWHRVSLVRDGNTIAVDPAKDAILPGDYIEIPRSYYEATKDLTLFLASLLSVVATAIIISSY